MQSRPHLTGAGTFQFLTRALRENESERKKRLDRGDRSTMKPLPLLVAVALGEQTPLLVQERTRWEGEGGGLVAGLKGRAGRRTPCGGLVTGAPSPQAWRPSSRLDQRRSSAGSWRTQVGVACPRNLPHCYCAMDPGDHRPGQILTLSYTSRWMVSLRDSPTSMASA